MSHVSKLKNEIAKKKNNLSAPFPQTLSGISSLAIKLLDRMSDLSKG